MYLISPEAILEQYQKTGSIVDYVVEFMRGYGMRNAGLNFPRNFLIEEKTKHLKDVMKVTRLSVPFLEIGNIFI